MALFCFHAHVLRSERESNSEETLRPTPLRKRGGLRPYESAEAYAPADLEQNCYAHKLPSHLESSSSSPSRSAILAILVALVIAIAVAIAIVIVVAINIVIVVVAVVVIVVMLVAM